MHERLRVVTVLSVVGVGRCDGGWYAQAVNVRDEWQVSGPWRCRSVAVLAAAALYILERMRR